MKYKNTMKNALLFFEERKRNNPDDVFSVKDKDWEYITIHPMGDESDLLKNLNISEEDCKSVDCYWRSKKNVAFVEVQFHKLDRWRDIGFYARRDDNRNPALVLYALVADPIITRVVLESVLNYYDELGLESEIFSNNKLKDILTKIDN